MCQDGCGRTGNNDTAESLKWGYSALPILPTIVFIGAFQSLPKSEPQG